MLVGFACVDDRGRIVTWSVGDVASEQCRDAINDPPVVVAAIARGHTLRERMRGLVLGRADIGEVHMSKALLGGELTEPPEDCMLDAAPEHTTAQQKRIDREALADLKR